MAQGFTQLTQEERYQIYEMKVEGKKPPEIAQALGRDRSTIYRECKRNKGQRAYRPH
jgi:IS30 family transposase